MPEIITLKNHPYITFVYFCGGRSGQAEMIEWSQVDLERKLIRIEDDQTKEKEAREIPLPQRLILMLERIELKQGRVFDTTNIRALLALCTAAQGPVPSPKAPRLGDHGRR